MHHTSTVKDAFGYKPNHGIITRDESTNRFITYESYQLFEDTYKLMLNRHIHEVITGDQKLRFDIDGDAAAHEIFAKPNIFGGTNWDDFIRDIQMAFELTYDIDLPYHNIVICDSSDETKFSRHIIIDGYYVTDNHEAKSFMSFVCKALPDEVLKYIDTGVYKSVQNLRIAGSTKVGSNRVKSIISKHTLMQSIVTYVKDSRLVSSVRKYSINHVNEPMVEIEDKLMQEAKNLAEPFMKGYKLWKTSSNALYYNRTISTYCNICNRTHDSVGCWIRVELLNGILKLNKHCYRSSGYVELCSKVVEQSKQDKPLTYYVLSMKDTVPTFRHAYDNMMNSGMDSEQYYMSIRRDLAKYKSDYEKNKRLLASKAKRRGQ